MQDTKWARIIFPLLFCILASSCSQKTFYLFFPPKDYYKPITKGIIDVSKDNASYTFAFINKYEGHYSMGIACSKINKEIPFRMVKIGFEADIKIFQNGKVIFTRHVTEATPYWFGYNKIGGYHFFLYDSPSDLPRNIPLACTIEITKGDPSFKQMYGETEFFISKYSDE